MKPGKSVKKSVMRLRRVHFEIKLSLKSKCKKGNLSNPWPKIVWHVSNINWPWARFFFTCVGMFSSPGWWWDVNCVTPFSSSHKTPTWEQFENPPGKVWRIQSNHDKVVHRALCFTLFLQSHAKRRSSRWIMNDSFSLVQDIHQSWHEGVCFCLLFNFTDKSRQK